MKYLSKEQPKRNWIKKLSKILFLKQIILIHNFCHVIFFKILLFADA